MLVDVGLAGALRARAQWVRVTDWRGLMGVLDRPAKVQARLLRGILRRQRATGFGREHGFARLDGYGDFSAAVPVQTYESLRPYVDEQERHDTPALNASAPVMYAQTSGTTGEAKLIPISARMMREHRRSQLLQWYAQFAWAPAAYAGRFLAIVSPAREGLLPSGRPYGSVSGFMYESMPAVARAKYVLPAAVFGVADYELKYRLILRLGIAARDITHIGCANPSTLLKLLSMLRTYREELLEDAARGRFDGLDALEPDVRLAVQGRLACDARRVAELREVLSDPEPTFAALWPGLRMVSTWTGGSCRIALARVVPALPVDTRITDLGYLSSEFRGTLVVDPRTGAAVPTIHENVFEFVERDDWEEGRQTFRTIDQLEEGREYYVFPTTDGGLYRYHMNDIVRVTGRCRQTPTLEFVQKGKGVTSITGEKLYERQVIDAVRAAEEELGVTSDFYLMLADADAGGYRLVMEMPRWPDSGEQAVIAAVERHLGRLNVEYAGKRASGRLAPLTLVAVQGGTGDAYKQECLRRGQREGQFKLLPLQYASECTFPVSDYRVARVS